MLSLLGGYLRGMIHKDVEALSAAPGNFVEPPLRAAASSLFPTPRRGTTATATVPPLPACTRSGPSSARTARACPGAAPRQTMRATASSRRAVTSYRRRRAEQQAAKPPSISDSIPLFFASRLSTLLLFFSSSYTSTPSSLFLVCLFGGSCGMIRKWCQVDGCHAFPPLSLSCLFFLHLFLFNPRLLEVSHGYIHPKQFLVAASRCSRFTPPCRAERAPRQ